MPPRNLNIIFLTFVLSALCYASHRRTKTALYVSDALNLINSYYVDPVNEEELLTAAMDGMTSRLDQHSEYIPAHEFETFQDNMSQEFAGIGIYVEQPAEGPPVRVVTPLVGSPALRAGMLPGDRFVRVGDEDVSSMGLREVSARLKGPVGTVVDVTVQRGKQDQTKNIDLRIERATIELESVIGDHRDDQNRWVYRLRDDPSIAYIRLTGFGEKSTDELRTVLKDLNNDFTAMVFDVRGNGGGLLETAIEVCDMFLDEGEIVSTRTRGGVMEGRHFANEGTLIDTSKPLAILIDGNSASASEIVAAALQDNHRASIVGTRSYGKGTVQNVLPLQYGRSALRLTVARFYRPSGENLDRGKVVTDDQGPSARPFGGLAVQPDRDQAAGNDQKWGVQPDEGLVVELEDESRKKLEKRRLESTYPSLVTPPKLSGKSDAPDQLDADQLDSESDVKPLMDEDDLIVDPQLRRAVEHLRSQIRMENADPAAA